MKKTKRCVFYALGLIFSIAPPIAATLSYFPLWKEAGDSARLSGFCVLLIILSLSPFIRHLKERFRSPSAHTVWLILFIVFFAVSTVANEMKVISLVGFIGNLIGAFFFKLSEGANSEDDN